jgi:hypothetical protein
MAEVKRRQKRRELEPDFSVLVEMFGLRKVIETLGPEKIIEEMGVDWLVSRLTPAQRKKFKERLQRE